MLLWIALHTTGIYDCSFTPVHKVYYRDEIWSHLPFRLQLFLVLHSFHAFTTVARQAHCLPSRLGGDGRGQKSMLRLNGCRKRGPCGGAPTLTVPKPVWPALRREAPTRRGPNSASSSQPRPSWATRSAWTRSRRGARPALARGASHRPTRSGQGARGATRGRLSARRAAPSPGPGPGGSRPRRPSWPPRGRR